MNLKKYINDIPDFPKEGVVFKDICPLLASPKATDYVVDLLAKGLHDINVTKIVGIESRGFLFGFLLANKIEIPFIPIRKVGKLPGETLKYKYDLEYGSAEMEIHKNDIKNDWHILVHDDLLATGGTACASAELIQRLGAKVAGFAFVVSLDFLKGKEKLKQYSNHIISLKDY